MIGYKPPWKPVYSIPVFLFGERGLLLNPVVSFSVIELAGLPRRRRAKYFEEANANGRELLHHARKRVKMHSFDVLSLALMSILLTNASSSTDSALCSKDFFLTYGNLLSGLSVL